jgi:hypothetical protein
VRHARYCMHSRAHQWRSTALFDGAWTTTASLPEMMQSLRRRLAEEVYLVGEALFQVVEADFREVHALSPTKRARKPRPVDVAQLDQFHARLSEVKPPGRPIPRALSKWTRMCGCGLGEPREFEVDATDLFAGVRKPPRSARQASAPHRRDFGGSITVVPRE